MLDRSFVLEIIQWVFNIVQKKTSVEYSVTLHPIAKTILDDFKYCLAVQ